MIKANLNMFSFTKTLIQADQNITLQVNLISNTNKIMKDLKWHFKIDECQKLQQSFFSTKYWYLAEIIVNKASISRLVDFLAIFS